jgi:hypothetical protein
LNTILAAPRQQLSAMADGDDDGNGQRRWQLWWPMVTEMAMADSKGNGNSNGDGWRQRIGDGGGNGQQWPQRQWLMAAAPRWQWPMAVAMAMSDGDGNGNSNDNGDGNGNGNRDRDGNGDRDSDSDRNDDGHGKDNNDKGRVASSCAGNVQRCGRSGTLPTPQWTQRSVHSPALRHVGDATKSVCSLSRGRVPDSSPWIVFYFLQLLFS